jgi:hypothetical protein
MSLQELLTKDYSKKPQLLLVRFTIIGGNLLIFLYCSGWHFNNRFGPIITAPLSYETVSTQMKSVSSLDMMALWMALLVVVRQLDFRRPEIDSYNEIVYLPAQESKSILALMLFSIFKFYYQFPRGDAGVIGLEGFFLDPYLKLNKNFRSKAESDDISSNKEKMMIFFNVLLILSSTICFFHSLTFKYVIKNTERNMILTVLDITNFLVKLITILDMILVIFIQDTKYLGILLLVVIVFDIFRITRISYLDKSRSGYTLSMRDYISSVKWISMFVFGIVLHGSLGAYFLVKFDLDKKSTIYKGVSNCLLFERNSRPEGSVEPANLESHIHSHQPGGGSLFARADLQDQRRSELGGVRHSQLK